MSATCTSRGAPIIFARTAAGKPMPLNAEPDPTGNVQIIDGRAVIVRPGTGTHTSHFADCPNAAQHRRPR